MDESDLFRTWAEVDPDFNESDEWVAAQRLLERQSAIEDWLEGVSPCEAVLDTLNDQGVNPDSYVQAVVQGVDFALSNQIIFESNELGLFLPVNG